MKIGLVIEVFDPRRGGVEQWTWQFASWLLAAGHEVHVIARQWPEDLVSDSTALTKARYHCVDAAATRLAFAAAVEGMVPGLNLDVVHDTGCGWQCDVWQPHGGSRAAAAEQNLLLVPAWLRPLKRQLTCWLPRYREFEQLAARQYQGEQKLFVAISKMVARDLHRHHGVPRQQLRLVYNGVDVDRFSPAHRDPYRDSMRDQLRIAADEVLLLIVAHNFRLKGVPTLLEAAGQLVKLGHKVRVAVAGGKQQRAYRKLARQAGVAAVTDFVGPVSDAVPYYAAADIYVQPTFYDPCSLVVLEALASALPVVTSRFNGAGELITPGKQGEIVNDPGDAAELRDALEPIVADAAARERMGRAARLLALDHPLERNCREMLAVYDEIAARQSKRAA